MNALSEEPSRPLLLAAVLEQELRDAGCCGTADTEISEEGRLRAVYRQIHALETPRSALCLSGGGIRSASFGLGVLQALAAAGLLGKFDYLSTVSGGGYIGGWLTAWIQNHPRGQAGVMEDLSAPPRGPLEPECAPLRQLRAFSSYLTPRFGLLSADAWTLAATWLRDVMLNWIVILSWLAVLLLIPRFLVFAVLARPDPLWLGLLLTGAFVSLAVSTAYAGVDLPSIGNARWKQRRFLAGWLAPHMASAIFFCAWWAGFRNTSALAESLMGSTRGLLLVGIFVGLACGTGCVASAVLLAWRDRRRRDVGSTWHRLNHLVGMVLMTVLLTGVQMGFLAWMVAAWVFPDPAQDVRNFTCFAVPLLLTLFFVANCVFNGLTSWWASDQDREWWGRATAWLGAGIVGWLVLNTLVLWAPTLVAKIQIAEVWKWLLAAGGGAVGLAAAVIGFSKTSVALPGEDRPFARSRILATVALAFFVLLSCVLSHLLDPRDELLRPKDLWNDYARVEFLELLAVIAVLAGVGIAMGFFINVNRFSLHAMYRNRLIRAFLGTPRSDRRPNWFTGFDRDDNIEVHRLKPGRPFHVVNIALNLVQTGKLAWQERKAASFTVSRLHCGSWPLGYRPSEHYGDGISLGTALAVSGAAASPNQGYNSSPVVAFLMTLFNLRLGWWLGNPGRQGAWTWRRAGPLHAALPLFNEALGNTTDTYPYVNLSDGGHFENLGLYEMVLRRCRHVVVVDAGCDSSYVFEDLGNAIRRIRIDFGVPVDIQVVSPRKPGVSASTFAVGTIRYSVVDGAGTDGTLLYIKPALCGEESADIAHYAAAHPDFPHEATSDHWFSETQMESYRALGCHVAGTICGGTKADNVAELFAALQRQLATKTATSV